MSVDAAPAGLCDRCRDPEPAILVAQSAYGTFHKFCAPCAVRTVKEKLRADREAESEIYSQGLEKRPVLFCAVSGRGSESPMDKGRGEGLESVT